MHRPNLVFRDAERPGVRSHVECGNEGKGNAERASHVIVLAVRVLQNVSAIEVFFVLIVEVVLAAFVSVIFGAAYRAPKMTVFE